MEEHEHRLSDEDVARIADAVVAKMISEKFEDRIAHVVVGKFADMMLRVLNETEKGVPEPDRRVVRVLREKLARCWYEIHQVHDTSWGEEPAKD